MFSNEALRELYLHMEWADAKVWQAALTLGGGVDERLRSLLLHIHTVQRAFLDVWTEQPLVFPEASEFVTLRTLHGRVSSYYEEARRFLDTRTAAQFAEPVVMPWVETYQQHLGRRFETTTLGETAFQVTSHSTYHRGQVNMRLRELGAEPPLVDFIAWVWFGKPAPDWSG